LGATAGSESYGNELGGSEALSANGKVAVVGAPERGVGGVVYVYAERAGSWHRVQTLRPATPVRNALFGWRVGLSSTGSTMMVDSPEANNGDGAVFVYARGKGGAWTQSAEIAGSSAQASGEWGQSAAISGTGTEVLVGDPFADKYHGAAYLYQETTAGAWQLAKTWQLSSGTKRIYFGWDVALSGPGTTALVSDYTNVNDSVNVYQASAGSWKRTSTITKSAAGGFGYSLALSANGSTAIVGAPLASNGEGAAYVYDHKNKAWSPGGTLSPSDGAANGQFGVSVALSQTGTAALAGAAPAGTGTDGAAYAFTSSAGTWSEQAELTPSDGQAGDEFGNAVALSSAGSTAVIGAPSANGGSGEAYVFQGTGGSWAQQVAWTQGGENSDDQFGTSVAIAASGDTAVVGAVGNGGSRGAAYVYTRRHGRLARSAELTASDGQQGSGFGRAVAISGNGSIIAVEGGGYESSAPSEVYVFDKTHKGWVQSAELAPRATEGYTSGFGWSLSLSDDGANLAVGGGAGPGHVNYYTRQQDGSWKLAQVLNGPSFYGFGDAVALSSDASTLFVGEDGGGPTIAGEVLAYTQVDGKWKKSATMKASNGEKDDNFGEAVAVSANGSRAVIAAPTANEGQGAMYVFSRNTKGQWHQTTELQAKDGQSGDLLGSTSACPCTIGLTAAGMTAVIGASRKANFAGAAYAFSNSSGKTWSQAAEFTSSPDYPQNAMGTSDAVSGNGSAIVVGASGTANSSGVAYIYTPGSTGWTLAQTLIDP
jgi:hypothetical protein